MVRVRDDLVGKIFGRLTVIDRAEDGVHRSGESYPRWVCKCECGNLTEVSGNALKRGGSKSCGCLKIQSCLRSNTVEVCGDTVKLMDTLGNTILVDKNIYDSNDIIKEHYWRCNNCGYVISTIKLDSGKVQTILLHRAIMEAHFVLEGKFVDHINGDKKDNRLQNLRLATPQENSHNRKIHKGNKANCNGVTFNDRDGKWIVRISIDKKDTYIGSFENMEGAIRARKEAEIKYYGDFRRYKD